MCDGLMQGNTCRFFGIRGLLCGESIGGEKCVGGA